MDLRDARGLISAYKMIRQTTELLCKPLELEDFVIQGMDDVSPPKWHLAHTTWFFEYFILKVHKQNFEVFNPLYTVLFNSYYQTIGQPFPRTKRGTLSRPTVKDIYHYRAYINEQIEALINHCSTEQYQIISPLLMLGLNHEQQHQELLLMDIKFNLSLNPEYPKYQEKIEISAQTIKEEFIFIPDGVASIGCDGKEFCFDNETPIHSQMIKPFYLANRLVTNQEYLTFMEDGGYQNPIYWLADGWEWVLNSKSVSPLYWQNMDHDWYLFTLHGLEKLDPYEPVCHVNFYEAHAYAVWRKKRLPTEFEWEHFVKHFDMKIEEGNFIESNLFHPSPTLSNKPLQQFFGNVWEWTTSTYSPYPGFKPFTGNLQEYNGKFMCNQIVLRGGSCATPKSHIRPTYRNFFQPEKRWAFTGIRLACDGEPNHESSKQF